MGLALVHFQKYWVLRIFWEFFLEELFGKTCIALKNLAPIPISKLDLGFGSQYQNLVSVAHYYYCKTGKKSKFPMLMCVLSSCRRSRCRHFYSMSCTTCQSYTYHVLCINTGKKMLCAVIWEDKKWAGL